jgi:GNAT superfamily N-acetyltransferase
MLRQLKLADMDAAARVHRTAFDRALPTLAGLHTPEEDRWFFWERVFTTCEVWGAFGGAEMTGILAFRQDWIDQLYVLPEAQGRGLGTALLQVAQNAFDRLQLWTFQRNVQARGFYEAREALRWCSKPTARATRRRNRMGSIAGRGFRCSCSTPRVKPSSADSQRCKQRFQPRPSFRECTGNAKRGGA